MLASTIEDIIEEKLPCLKPMCKGIKALDEAVSFLKEKSLEEGKFIIVNTEKRGHRGVVSKNTFQFSFNLKLFFSIGFASSTFLEISNVSILWVTTS